MKIRTLPCLVPVLFLCLAVLAPCLWAQSAPTLSLTDAVELAEKALTDKEVVVDQYYLSSVVLSHASSGDYWNCKFQPSSEERGAGGYGVIYVRVYMDSTVEVALPRLPVRYRNK